MLEAWDVAEWEGPTRNAKGKGKGKAKVKAKAKPEPEPEDELSSEASYQSTPKQQNLLPMSPVKAGVKRRHQLVEPDEDELGSSLLPPVKGK
jgi:hypothetical protein